MGNICPCPKRKQQKGSAYNVHQQTFEIEENISTPQVPQQKKKQEKQMSSGFQMLNQENGAQEEKQPQKIAIIKQTSESELKQLQQPVIAQIKEEPPKKKVYSFQKKKVNLDDYRFVNLSGEFRIKKIDSISQQQFNIDGCKNCSFFIFDITANLYVDNSQNCTIFLAPCESTVFLRDCKNIKMVAATKQFRTRDCFDCSFSIYCNSQPVIESSGGIVFSDFPLNIGYPQLLSQFSKAKMEVFNNHWSQIHDFTKKENIMHYTLSENINFELDFNKALIEAGLQASNSIVPHTRGELPKLLNTPQHIVLFNKIGTDRQSQLINYLVSNNITVSRSFKGKFPSEALAVLRERFEDSKASDSYIALKASQADINKLKEYLRAQQSIVISENTQSLSLQLFVSFKDQH